MSGVGSKLRSCRVASDSNMAMAAHDTKNVSLAQSCWANMPSELLREVLIKIEASESTWPSRRNVVVCAGVCRSWREIVRDIVKRPELSGILTFPISLKQPGPRDSPILCFITRNRSAQTFHLCLNSTQASALDGKFLLAACRVRHSTRTEYIISMHPNNFSKGYIGKLRSNFSATKFIVSDALPPHHEGAKVTKSPSIKVFGSKQVSPRLLSGNYPVAHVSYELNPLGSRGPRKMQCIMDGIPVSAVEPGGVAPTQTEFPLYKYNSFSSLQFFRPKPSSRIPSTEQGALVMRNKSARWHEQLQCWCLNFHGRVTIASVKNFQLVAAPRDELATPERENVILQFGKVGKDLYTMDYTYPLSAFQAFAICLSSFDTKVACE